MQKLILGLILGLGLSTNVDAGVLTFAYEARVTSVTHDDLGLSISIGTTLTGQFAYDTTTPDTNGATDQGNFEQNILGGFFAQFPGINATAGDYRVQVADNSGGDWLFVQGFGNGTVGGTTYQNVNLSLFLGDNSETVFSSDSLPNSLQLGDFNVANGSFQVVDGGTTADPQSRLFFDITRIELLSPPIVPEPTSLIVLAALFAPVSVARRRRV